MVAAKTIVPTVVPKPQVIDMTEAIATLEPSGRSLPPISHIKPPVMAHTSTKIRWYLGLGYTIKEVSSFLGVRYQQVRNVGVQTPKRAAREDVPPYVFELWEPDDDIDAMEAFALEQQMSAQRDQDRKAKKALKARKSSDQGSTYADADEADIEEGQDDG